MVGRPSPGGPVDDLTLESGHWPTRPDQVVLGGVQGPNEQLGSQITVTGVPGSPQLTIVGFATSITQTAQAWVAAVRAAALRAPGTPDVSQMLYRFSNADAPPRDQHGYRAVRAALPSGAVLGAQSYLTVKLQATGSIAPWVPFIVAFGVIGLVMSVLIVANVVSGAVVAGNPPDRRAEVHRVLARRRWWPRTCSRWRSPRRRLPWPVCSAGNLLAVPLLSQTAQVYGVGALAVPVWVDVAVPLAMLGLAGAAAAALALRAGRMSAVQAIATGRAPRPDRGYAAHRVLGRVPGPGCPGR